MSETYDVDLGGSQRLTGLEPVLGGERKKDTLESIANEINLLKNEIDLLTGLEYGETRMENDSGFLIGQAKRLIRTPRRLANFNKIEKLRQQEYKLFAKGSEIIKDKPGTYGISNVNFITFLNSLEQRPEVEINYYTIVNGVQFSANKRLPNLTYRQSDIDQREAILTSDGNMKVIVDPNPKWNTFFVTVFEEDRQGRYVTVRWEPRVSENGFRQIRPLLPSEEFNALYSLRSDEIQTEVL